MAHHIALVSLVHRYKCWGRKQWTAEEKAAFVPLSGAYAAVAAWNVRLAGFDLTPKLFNELLDELRVHPGLGLREDFTDAGAHGKSLHDQVYALLMQFIAASHARHAHAHPLICTPHASHRWIMNFHSLAH